MKKTLCLCLSLLMLLALGLPCARAASPASYRDWTNVVQVLLRYDSSIIALRADGTVLFDGPADSIYASVRTWTGVSHLEFDWFESELIGYRADGTVLTTAPYDLSGWTHIHQVVLVPRISTAFGLREDGTVVAAPGPYTFYEDFDEQVRTWDLDSWNHVVAIDDNANEILGLRKDGTVCFLSHSDAELSTRDSLTEYLSSYGGWGNPENWTNIVSFSSLPSDLTFAVRKDGTVLGLGRWEDSDYSSSVNLADWHDIVCFYYTGGFDFGGYCIGLRKDGSVAIYAPYEENARPDLEQVRSWTGVTQLWITGDIPLGLKKNGTAAYVDVDSEGNPTGLDLSAWKDLQAVYSNGSGYFGLRNDGTVLLASKDADREWVYDEYGVVESWTNIAELIMWNGRGGWIGGRVVGLRTDGTVVATPESFY